MPTNPIPATSKYTRKQVTRIESILEDYGGNKAEFIHTKTRLSCGAVVYGDGNRTTLCEI